MKCNVARPNNMPQDWGYRAQVFFNNQLIPDACQKKLRVSNTFWFEEREAHKKGCHLVSCLSDAAVVPIQRDGDVAVCPRVCASPRVLDRYQVFPEAAKLFYGNLPQFRRTILVPSHRQAPWQDGSNNVFVFGSSDGIHGE